jgi:hypothetical protein
MDSYKWRWGAAIADRFAETGLISELCRKGGELGGPSRDFQGRMDD